MAKKENQREREAVSKRTCQGGKKPKPSTMNKSFRRSFKPTRGQG